MAEFSCKVRAPRGPCAQGERGNAEDIPEAWKDCSVFACEQSDTGLAACPCSDGKTRVLAPRGATSHLDCVRTIHCSQDAGSSTMCMAAAFSADGFLLAVVTHNGCVLVYVRSLACLPRLRRSLLYNWRYQPRYLEPE